MAASAGGFQGLADLENGLEFIRAFCREKRRPFVTVTYAQSLDGSIASRDRKPLCISGSASMTMTHRLRTLFDAILVGIETVLSDNPQLTARLAEGSNPQPVVLDTHLRTPSGCRLLQREDCSSWLVCSGRNSIERVDRVSRSGATVLPCQLDRSGRVDLSSLGELLYARGISSLMVEGGSRVITSFILARMVDLFVITISPTLVGGLQVVEPLQPGLKASLELKDLTLEQMDNDLVLWARPEWDGL